MKIFAYQRGGMLHASPTLRSSRTTWPVPHSAPRGVRIAAALSALAIAAGVVVPASMSARMVAVRSLAKLSAFTSLDG
jgi:hypothetical protein